jgi:hypothetical protein
MDMSDSNAAETGIYAYYSSSTSKARRYRGYAKVEAARDITAAAAVNFMVIMKARRRGWFENG